MSDDETNPIPSLSSEEVTPVSSPQPMSRSQQRRRAIQEGKPLPTFGDAKLVLPDGRVVEPMRSPPPVYEASALPKPYVRWRVKEDMEVPRGASSFFLFVGQVISEQHYEIEELIAKGVKLEKMP
jgi:hypothetical protein